MKFNNRKYKLLGILRKSFGVALLLVYCFSILQYTLQIEHHHVHEEELCKHDSLIHEIDPCHRSLIHHDLENGCKHATHFSNPLKHCSLCDILLHFDQLIIGQKYFLHNSFAIVEEIKFIQIFIPAFYHFHQSRGPPFSS